ncbi:MAG: glycosyltransferase family 39 protein [Bryobacteraceae bacterium]|nr:glycosyltransferase family 39 protein [Bryobacteraceae bacterium]
MTNKHAVWAALAAAVILFAIPAGKPLLLDNMDFPAVARATAETGLPIYYRGEENPRHSGLYHPPLYIYLLAGWFRIWGFGEVQARLFGFACALLHGAAALLLVRRLLGSESARLATPWFWTIFLLNPYTLQGAAVADIDTTIYGPLLLAMMTAAALPAEKAVSRSGSFRDLACLAAATALCLWAKLTTVLSVAPAAVALLAGALGWRRALLRGAAALGAGAAMFLASYGLYGWLTGQDISYTFRFLVMSYQQRSGQAAGLEWLVQHWRTFRDMTVWQILWTGLLPWVVPLATLGWMLRAGRPARGSAPSGASAPLAWALFVTAFYCFLTYSFGWAPFKYVYVAWGVVCACIALWTGHAWRRLLDGAHSRELAAGGAALALASFVFSGRTLRDGMVLGDRDTMAGWMLLILPAAAALAGLALWKRRIGPSLYWGSTLVWLGAMAGLALAMARAPYPTTYYYGQTGFEETVCFLREHTQPGEAILSMKDVGFRTGRRYFENYGYLFSGAAGADKVRALLDAERFRWAVFTEGIGVDSLTHNPELGHLIRARCALERSYGHYRIYDCAAARTAGSSLR